MFVQGKCDSEGQSHIVGHSGLFLCACFGILSATAQILTKTSLYIRVISSGKFSSIWF